MDGVLTREESSWVAVHKHHGLTNDESLHAFLNGEIDDQEFIQRDVALWLGQNPSMTLNDVDQILERALTPVAGATEAIQALHAQGVATAIVSGGIDLAARRLAQTLGIPLVSANGLHVDAGGQLTGSGSVATPLAAKHEPVLRFAHDLGAPLSQVVAVGNSSPDVAMFRSVGFGIAFRPTDAFVVAEADCVVTEPDLRRLVPHILGSNEVKD